MKTSSFVVVMILIVLCLISEALLFMVNSHVPTLPIVHRVNIWIMALMIAFPGIFAVKSLSLLKGYTIEFWHERLVDEKQLLISRLMRQFLLGVAFAYVAIIAILGWLSAYWI